jgi:putative transposase
LYLAALVDVYSRKVVGGAMSGIRDEQLAENALWMALIGRQPGAGLVHHSDRGSQYTARSYRGVLEHYGVELSMSRKGNCWDSALCARFFGSLKVECTDRYRFAIRQQAKTVAGYIRH